MRAVVKDSREVDLAKGDGLWIATAKLTEKLWTKTTSSYS